MNRVPVQDAVQRLQKWLVLILSLSNGIFHFVINAPVGSNCVVQASSNLINWWPVVTNAIPSGGSLPITDPSMTNQSPRFYRVPMP